MPQQSRSAVMTSNSHIDTAYSLSLLSEYNHTLDSLPLDLSRNFADLRELDAVLSTAMASITAKIHTLTQMIEDGKGKEERLWLLSEIAEEARTLKPGGEDKIRVACQAADNLKSHVSHLRTLAEHIPGFDASILNRQTSYPHVASKTFMPVTMTEGGRRRRGNYGSLLTSATDPSPVKRKRAPRDDDGTPRKERAVDGPSRPRNGGRGRRNERAGSPADSVLSVTSYMPPPPPQGSSRGGSTHGRTNGTGNAHGGNRRSRTAANSHRGGSPQNEHYPNGTYDPGLPNHGSRREAFHVPPSASHPSLPLPYHPNGNPHPFELHIPNGAPGGVPAGPGEWPIPRQLEGPGVPVARNPATYSDPGMPMNVGSGAEDEGTVEQDGEADGDNRRYCVCDGYSYGDMIACDDSNCEREWFHLTCIGLEVPPEGKWYCENCSNKKPVKRPGRGGKRRGGHRAGAGRGTT